MSHSRRMASDLALDWPSKPSEVRPEPAVLRLDRVIAPPGSSSAGEPDRLIEGDNLAIAAALLPNLNGRFALMYADPPFMSGKRYDARIGRNEDSRKPGEWLMGEGYDDRWQDPAAYLTMMYERLYLMRALLSDRGTLYLHADWHASHYLRLLLDELFGSDRLLNEITWVYHGPSPIRRAFNRKHDTILAYTRSADYVFNTDDVRVPYDASTVQTFASSRKAGFGKVPDLERGKVPEDWWYFPVVARLHGERTGYPTQKPEALVERIIRASSDRGDLVGDLFCGSGTLPVVAGRLGRRWLAADASPRAIHTTIKRLLDRPGCRPFEVWATGPGSVAEAGAVARLEHAGVGAALRIVLRDYQADIPAEACARAGTFADLIDYWEIDPDPGGDAFNSRWQSFRSRTRGELQVEAALDMQGRQPGPVAVRIVDVTGRASLWFV